MISDGYVDAITGSVGRVGRGTCPPRPWPAGGGALCRQAMAEGIDASVRMNCSRGWIPTGWS
jgi:hypothetical protein